MNQTDAYRIDAMLELAAAPRTSLTVAEIARRRAIPPRFLARLLGELAQNGLIKTTRGPRGGVTLATAPAKLPLRAVISAAGSAPSGGAGVRWLHRRLKEAQRASLERVSLGDLLKVEQEQTVIPDFSI